MSKIAGKYEAKRTGQANRNLFVLLPLSFFLVEVFGFDFLVAGEEFELLVTGEENDWQQMWPLAFGAVWSVLLTAFLRVLPAAAARITYGVTYFLSLIYAGFQTGYYLLFSEMMWISDFRYASEGSDYAGVLLSYPVGWYLWLLGLIALGVVTVWKFPVWKNKAADTVASGIIAVAAAVGAFWMPELVFRHDSQIQYAGSDYGRAQSAEAAYDNMFNTERLYQICGLYQTAVKDIYANVIYPVTPGYAHAQSESRTQIDAYFADRQSGGSNAMTGLLEGKNVVLVLMESMDDWMIGDHTPTLVKLMEEGINFTSFYTPVYGGIRTFNSEFCANTGSFLSSQGGYAFDYVTNDYSQSLASLLTDEGYSAKTFHYNDPSFYSRGEFSPAMGYDEYVCYADYLEGMDEDEQKKLLYDDLLLFSNQELREEFFREGQPTLNFIITRSAHLSYKYNEVLSYWGLKKYPEYKGMTGNEETDCALLKARLVDDLFQWLLMALEDEGQLENTVIIGVTDHYTYGYKDTESLLELSGVESTLMLERTPCFIWSADMEAMEVDKTLNTSDLLPTVLNLLGVHSPYSYIGSDAFDESYDGFVPFSNGSWICGDVAYDADEEEVLYLSGDAEPVTEEFMEQMSQRVSEFTRINNLILETNYYHK